MLTCSPQRPVEWILYNPSTSTALVLISEEAELVIPKLRAQKARTKTHLLTYSAPITKKMLHFSALRYYALPQLPINHVLPHWLTIEIGIFAGRLYMEFEESAPLVNYIEKGIKGKQLNMSATGTTSFLIEWLSLRRKGQDIMHTPVGYVCQGRALDSTHAFFVTHHLHSATAMKPYTSHATGSISGNEDSDDDNDDGEEQGEDEDKEYE